MGEGKNTTAHVMAIATATVWGITFVSTKIVLDHGLSPAEIMFYRFLIAYLLILPFAPRRVLANSPRDEMLFVALGVTGCSFYFIAENVALQHTLAANVSLLVSTAPLLTTLLAGMLPGERPGRDAWRGSVIALSGVALVVYNGHLLPGINLAGDLLSLAAAVSWGVYTIIVRGLGGRYSTLFITRKVFFYGLLTLLPVFYFTPPRAGLALLLSPVVSWNLLFLGVLASFACFILWNRVIKKLGAVRASNYIYLNPVVTLVASAIILHERVTPLAIAGTLLVIGGVYVVERRARK